MGTLFALAAITGPTGPHWTSGTSEPVEAAVQADDAEEGLRFRVGEGTDAPPPPLRVPPAAARPLADTDVQKVLDRLPRLDPDPSETGEFRLRERSLPPPRTGRTVQAAFPPAAERARPDAGDAGPLRVLRRQPEGDVPLAPLLSVTFSKPMVSVTSHDALAREVAPVRLTPEPPGRWRWVGTKTLLFEAWPRLAMATEYRAEVPAGTRSAAGAALAAAERWSFRTPPPTIVESHPKDAPARRDGLVFVAFDQRIDPAAVLSTIRVEAGGATRTIRLASPEEVKADDETRRRADAAPAGRWLVFRTSQPLPAAESVTVTVGSGTSSAEGPLRTTKPQSWTFRTFGPLRVARHECGWSGECPPGAPWRIEMTNPLDVKRFRKEQVRVEPPLPELTAHVYDDELVVSGRAKGRTRYRVTLSAALADVFGQTLGREESRTFDVTAAPPALWSSAQALLTLDPGGPPRLSVNVVNHRALRVRAYAVTPADWSAYREYARRASREEAGEPPGRQVMSRNVPVAGAPDEVVEVGVDLSPALPGGRGQAVVIVERAGAGPDDQRIVTWVQATTIGLDAFVDRRSLTAWATSLADGRPIPGVDLQLLPSGAQAKTEATGLASLPLNAGADVLVARRGDDVAMLPGHLYVWAQGAAWQPRPAGDALRWFVFDDRGLYRPGEDARVKGWIRLVGQGPKGDVGPLAGAATMVRYALLDSRGNEVTRGERRIDAAYGAFDLALSLPATMNLGNARLRLTSDAADKDGREFNHVLRVQEFRRPEFEVKTAASEGPHFVGGRADLTVTAAYYAGGALPDAEVNWQVSSSTGTFTPPNRDGFTFGKWVPWWERFHARPGGERKTTTYGARTDALGRHRLRIDFDAVRPALASSVVAQATVRDVNRQAWTSSTTLLVHAADVYVGLRSGRAFVQQGEPLTVESIAVDLDGRAVPGRPLRLRAERLEWQQIDGEWKETPTDPQDCSETSGPDVSRCRFETREGGAYRVTATVTDGSGRRNDSEIRLWVAGGTLPPRRDVAQEKVTLVPGKKDYAVGDTAEILVLAPFAPAEGLLTLRRSGILKTERFTLTGPSHTLRVPLEDGMTPNVHVQVDLVGAAARDDGRGQRPAFASGSLDLPVPPSKRALALSVTPRESALEPGGRTTVDMEVRDASGRATADAQVALVVVDEAVLALTGYSVRDPLSVFYAPREPGVSDHHLRATVRLAKPEESQEKLAALGYVDRRPMKEAPRPAAAPPPQGRLADAVAEEAAAPPIRARVDFNPLAVFAASVRTDAAGRASVEVPLPDNLTRYRITAVTATPGASFGKGESTITARLPLMARPSPPRFLNFGDRAELPVVLQNQTDQPLEVDVALRAANADLAGPRGFRVAVPANDRAEVRFPVAASRAGSARFQVGAVAGRFADAAVVRLPVWTPATTEAFATYGQIDDGVLVQPVKAPADVVPQFGGLEITTSSTALQALTDAVLYLVSYPFECAEQLSSRVLAVAALRDVLAAFGAEGLPKPDELLAAVQRDLDRLKGLQNADGGFAFWRRGDESWPYVSIHAAHALVRAKAKGFTVPEDVLKRAGEYLKSVESRIPAWYGPEARRTLTAYALHVRHRMGDRDARRARQLLTEAGVEGLSFEALGWLLPVVSGDTGSATEVATIRRHFANRVAESAGTAHFTVSYGDGAHLLLHSDRRADAVVLEALIEDQPNHDLIPKLVAGLLGHRKQGRWTNTQENVFVLLALDRYFGAYEKTTPDFVARAWLGDGYAGEHAFRGRTTERHRLAIPMSILGRGAPDLLLAKDGPGRLYYRIGLSYAPASLTLAPADHGFTVERRYEGLDSPEDVRRDADGTWRITAGARVRVRLTMVSPQRRYHVALVDPLPAGLEPSNPELATTERLPPDTGADVTVIGGSGLGDPRRPGHWWWWRGRWYEHQNLRDERVEAFASLLFEGVYNYSYVARATTPGQFVVPPPKAEEMYAPETFGRGGTDRVIVE
jgi:hypothetical protein